jgi:hypothetical protein
MMLPPNAITHICAIAFCCCQDWRGCGSRMRNRSSFGIFLARGSAAMCQTPQARSL